VLTSLSQTAYCFKRLMKHSGRQAGRQAGRQSAPTNTHWQ